MFLFVNNKLLFKKICNDNINKHYPFFEENQLQQKDNIN